MKSWEKSNYFFHMFSHQHSSIFHFCIELHGVPFNLHLPSHGLYWSKNLFPLLLTLNYILLQFYFIWNRYSNIWIITSVTTSTTLVNTDSKWIFMHRLYPEFISTSVDIAWHGQLLRDTRFIHPLELEINMPKLPFVRAFSNPINMCLINPNILYIMVSL